MEAVVKKMEKTSSYGMREDIVSGCEEWSSNYSQKAPVLSKDDDDDRNGECVLKIYCLNRHLIFLGISLVDVLSK